MSSMKRTGDWGKTKRLISRLESELQKSRDISLKRFGLKAEGIAKGHISDQDLPWAPLDPKTIARKARAGYSTNILVQTSSYFQSITSFRAGEKVLIGVRKNAVNKDGTRITPIAAVHENGSITANIPARKLWKPTFEETLKWHAKNNRPDIIFRERIKKYL